MVVAMVEQTGPASGPGGGPPTVYHWSEMSKASSGTGILTGTTPELLPISAKKSCHALGCARRESLSASTF